VIVVAAKRFSVNPVEKKETWCIVKDNSWGATGSASASQVPTPFGLTLARPVAHNTKIKL
jgi:hypothetical protein